MTTHRLCFIHPIDPREPPSETREIRLRAVLASLPTDFSALFVGVDRFGELRHGEVSTIDVAGRAIDFLPVGRDGGALFAAALMRHLPAIRAAARAERTSISVHTLACVPLARFIGRPIVLMVHADPRAGAVAGRVPFAAALRETLALNLADRVVAADTGFVRRCREVSPAIAAKTELLPLTAIEPSGANSGPSTDVPVTRLWERHRRLFDVHAVHRAGHVAA